MNWLPALATMCFLFPLHAMAVFPGDFDGTEEGFWARYSVVVGRVLSQDQRGLTLDVVAVVTTNSIVMREIHVTYEPTRGYRSLLPLEPGKLYVLCLNASVNGNGEDWSLYDIKFRFMESQRGVDAIDKLSDEKLRRIRINLDRARKRGQEQMMKASFERGRITGASQGAHGSDGERK